MTDDFFVPDEPIEEIRETLKRGTRRGVTRPPTNDELAERAKDQELVDVVRRWINNHRPGAAVEDERRYAAWLDWAAANFVADPEVMAVLSIMVQRAYQRGFEDGRRAGGEHGGSAG